MTTYYVRKSGNDTTGDGSTATPWLTINKALTTVSLAGGHTIKVGAGTYAENGGSGYLTLTQHFLDWVTVESESGAQDVIIRGTGATYNIWMGSGNPTYLRFRNIDFTPQAITRAVILLRGGDVNHLEFINCKIPAQGSEKAIEIFPALGTTYSTILFDGCQITGGPTSTNFVFLQADGTIDGVTFNNCAITSAGNGTNGIYLYAGTTLQNVTFQDCAISFTGNYTNVVYLTSVAGGTLSAVTFQDTSISVLAPGVGTYAVNLSSAGSIDDVTFQDCPISVTGTYTYGVSLNSIDSGTFTNFTFSGCSVVAPTVYYAFAMGNDSGYPTGTFATVSITNSSFSGTNHVLFLGLGSANATLDGNTIQGTVYGLIIKEGNGHTVTRCTIKGGSNCSLYFKAAKNCDVSYCTISNALAVGVQALNNPETGEKCQNITFDHNKIITSGAARTYAWGGADHDAGGCVLNDNTFRVGGSGKLGNVRADASAVNIGELRTAWADYGDGTNESRSKYESVPAMVVTVLQASKL